MEEIKEETITTEIEKKPNINIKKVIAWAILVVVVIVLIVLIVAIVNTVKRNKQNRIENENNNGGVVVVDKDKENVIPTPKPEETKPSVSTDMVSFIQEYKDSVSSANEKYVGKEIETYGYIQNMTTSMADGSPFISIIPEKTNNIYMEERIQCFVSSEDIFENFKVGDGVVVKGVVQTFEFGFIPFKNCSVRK